MTARTALFLGLALLPAGATAQRTRAFEIMDNSFLVEEAFNQEAGVFQNIFLFQQARSGGDWGLEFTQEWPLWSQRHQFSYTVPVGLNHFELGNIQLNYRLQARLENSSGPALSPRVSMVLPTGGDDDDDPIWGLQVNLPASRQFGDVYLHANAGLSLLTWEAGLSGVAGEGTISLLTPQASASLIWRTRPLLHLMLESVARLEEQPDTLCCSTGFQSSWIVSPGVRVARNLGKHQLVLGAAVPLSVVGERDASVLLYLSYELPFRAAK